MKFFKYPAARVFGAAVGIVGAIALASPLYAASSDSTRTPASVPAGREMLAQAAPQVAMAEPAPDSAEPSAVEARIRDLHKRLHITAAQKTDWENLTAVMRDNAQAMVDLQKERSADVGSMSAVDVVKSYESVIAAHDAGMKKFIPPFEALYDTMSDSQKRTADAMFRTRERTSAAKQTAENK